MITAYLNSFFWLFLTYFLAPYFYLRIFLRRKKNGTLHKILVIQTGKIGDLVCATPVFREIKKKFPSAHLTALVLSKAAGALKNNPRINKTILIDNYRSMAGKLRLLRELRKEKYDWAFNIFPDSFTNIISFWSLIPNRATTTYKYSGEIIKFLSVFNNYRLEYKSHTWLIGHYLNLLKFLGIEQPSEEKEVFIKQEEEKKALDFLSQNNLRVGDLLIGVSPVTGNKIKQWDLSKFAVLSDLLIEKAKAKIIFIGSADDRAQIEKVQKMMRNNSINGSDRFKLHELPALLKNLKLFISLDSGPLYIANAVGTPLVNIGGSGDIREQAPSGKNCRILQKYLAPCTFIITNFPACLEKYQKNLREITPEEVFEAAIDLIN